MPSSEFGIRNSESAAVTAASSLSFRLPPSAFRLPYSLRPGISLMEVLISIGIVAVGLLSIASLLPVGSIQAQRADVEHRKTVLGLNVLREFTTRGLGIVDPNNAEKTAWIRANGQEYFPLSGSSDPFLPPVAIDPLMVAAGASNPTAIENFPVTTLTGVPLMRRLTVHQACEGSGPPHPRPMALAQAICVPRDDTVVDQPSDSSLPATNYPPDLPSGQPLARNYAGEYSWLATITPGDAGTANSPPAAGQNYTLSIVVFNRRLMLTPTAGSGQEEMVRATVDAGYGGGEVQLELTDNQQSSIASYATHPLDLVTPGQWIMLCRNEPAGAGTWRNFKWYRVVSAAPIEAGSGQINGRDARYVTLAGPDWVPDSVLGLPAGSTYACLFAGAVAVHERTIRLEEPGSKWNP